MFIHDKTKNKEGNIEIKIKLKDINKSQCVDITCVMTQMKLFF